MFQWSITLSDKQVMMLIGFHIANDDEFGCRFRAVHHMIADAWDVRSARKLTEMGLLKVEPGPAPMHPNKWNITDKGNLIASAILEDADMLKCLGERAGAESRSLVNAGNSEVVRQRKEKERAMAA
jgi:hypothetical protein